MTHRPSFVHAIRFAPIRCGGFTLIEVMITVAIVAILAAIALPSYLDYILRGQLVDATTLLSAGRANMERYFQDNRTYAAVASASALPPCDASIAAAQRTQGKFVMTCSTTPDATTYTLMAQGSGSVAAFQYFVDQTGSQKTILGPNSRWNASGAAVTYSCWVMKKGQVC